LLYVVTYDTSQSAVLLVAEKIRQQFLLELFVAEIVVLHVERQTWSGSDKAPAEMCCLVLCVLQMTPDY